MGPARRPAGRDRPGLTQSSAAAGGDRRLRERIGGLLLSRGLSRAQRDPAPLLGAPRLQSFLGDASGSGLARAAFAGGVRLDGNGRTAQGGDPGCDDIGVGRGRCDRWLPVRAPWLQWPAARPCCGKPARVAMLVSSAGAGAGVSAAGASLCTEISGTGDVRLRGLRRGVVLRLQRDDFLGLIRHRGDRRRLGWRRGRRDTVRGGRLLPAPVRRAASPARELTLPLGVSPAASFCRANIGSGATRHAGVLANSSWAARSRAAAPSPNTRTDIDSTIAASRKRKPGSMERDFRLRSACWEGL